MPDYGCGSTARIVLPHFFNGSNCECIKMDFIFGRFSILFYSIFFTVGFAALSFLDLSFAIPLFFLIPLSFIGLKDFFQKKSNVIANFPVLARARFMLESIRPEIRQYFLEGDDDKLPFSRNQREMVYRRSKNVDAVRSFGSLEDFYCDDYTWLNHSIKPSHIIDKNFRVLVGSGKSKYEISVLNISGTSFGALSPNAIQALNTGAKKGMFAHNTGEGSLSKYHELGGGDLIWQISTGYFGCRTEDGLFDEDKFSKTALSPQVKMIEIKLSQGAKPGHGGMLLGSKVTQEIAEARGIDVGKDCISPSSHSAFSTPIELLSFAEKLKKLSNGKPVGIKLCIGHPWEFLAIVKAMVEQENTLDFVTVDGSEGGTGAAIPELSDKTGCPLDDALIFVDNCLKGAGLREKVKIGASGKIVSGFDVVHKCALGADWCNMARPFMFSLGCIQARDCSSGKCPTGIATMDPARYRALDIDTRSDRVANFHSNTINAVCELLESAGLMHPYDLTRRHIVRRLSSSKIRLLDQIYPKLEPKSLLQKNFDVEDERIQVYWNRVSGNSFNAS